MAPTSISRSCEAIDADPLGFRPPLLFVLLEAFISLLLLLFMLLLLLCCCYVAVALGVTVAVAVAVAVTIGGTISVLGTAAFLKI